jgi:hypothetical protein
MFYFMESSTIIIIFFARLVHFQGGEGSCEKEYSLYACDNDEKDGPKPLDISSSVNMIDYSSARHIRINSHEKHQPTETI